MTCITQIFTLKFKDGSEQEVVYPMACPDWIFIKATTDLNGQLVPRLTDHDRFDFNQRGREAWWNDVWVYLKSEMVRIGKTCSIYHINPYHPMGGFVPNG